MGLELLDLIWSLERRFGVKLWRDQISINLFRKHDPPDLKVGDLFELILAQAPQAGVLDVELDAEDFWPMFRREVSEALGIDEEEVTKETYLYRDLGAD